MSSKTNLIANQKMARHNIDDYNRKHAHGPTRVIRTDLESQYKYYFLSQDIFAVTEDDTIAGVWFGLVWSNGQCWSIKTLRLESIQEKTSVFFEQKQENGILSIKCYTHLIFVFGKAMKLRIYDSRSHQLLRSITRRKLGCFLAEKSLFLVQGSVGLGLFGGDFNTWTREVKAGSMGFQDCSSLVAHIEGSRIVVFGVKNDTSVVCESVTLPKSEYYL